MNLVLVACGPVENRVILPVPAAIFSPALRIHVALDADHGRSPFLRLCRHDIWGRRGIGWRICVRLGRRQPGRDLAWRLRHRSRAALRLGCFPGALDGSRDPPKLSLRGVEQIVGLVRRLGIRGSGFSDRSVSLGNFLGVLDTCIDRARLFAGGERLLAVIGPGVCGIASYGRSPRPRDSAKLFLRGVEQIVGLVRRPVLRSLVGGGRFLPPSGLAFAVGVLGAAASGCATAALGATAPGALRLGLAICRPHPGDWPFPCRDWVATAAAH